MYWKKTSALFIILMLFLPFALTKADDFNWNEHSSLKVSIKTEATIYEWEYENPNDFEYEKGERIVRGEEAKTAFQNIMQYIDLGGAKLENEVVEKIEEDLGASIVRMEIFRRDQNYYLQTWLWTKEN